MLFANSLDYRQQSIIKSCETAQKDIDYDLIEFWVVMNMMYSDCYLVAKKFDITIFDFCVEMAKTFLDNKNVQDNKLMNYFSCLVK